LENLHADGVLELFKIELGDVNGIFWSRMKARYVRLQEPHGVTTQKTPFFKAIDDPNCDFLCHVRLYIQIEV
jgi:hypothetical protein